MASKQKTEEPSVPNPINMTFLGIGMIDPAKVDVNIEFQREIETRRLKTINRSMNLMNGMFDHAKPIVLGEDGKAIDGKHRIELAIKRGMKEIPYVQYKFASPVDAVRYFQLAQIKTMGMKARDELFAYLKSDHCYARLIYMICESKHSILSGFHDLKLEQGHKSTNDSIKVENICYIINAVVLGRKTGWARVNADYLHTIAEPVVTNSKNIKMAINDVNEFIKFFLNSFGWSTKRGELKFKEHFLLGFLELYTDVLKPTELFKKDQKKVESKLSKFKLIPEVTKNHKHVIREKLLKHINSRRTKIEKIYI